MYDVIVVGGGLSGLVSAFLLKNQGMDVLVVEKKSYPFHRVCGEYVSNEVIPFLKTHDLFPEELGPTSIDRFRITSIKGRALDFPLDLGGFGISRYLFDEFLFEKCVHTGVEVLQKSTVSNIQFEKEHFLVQLQNGTQLKARIVTGTFGKRSNLDKALKRSFMEQRSPYIGVKYHVEFDYPDHLITLHNFRGGYCGISKVEKGVANLCYLGKRSYLKEFKDVETMEKNLLCENPFLGDIFQNAKFLFKKPMVINEISFATKTPVENHILMGGDSAGMITPLCGNGMAIALRSAKIMTDSISKFFRNSLTRNQMEQEYTRNWMKNFRTRLWAGRNIQKLFGKYNLSEMAVETARFSPTFRNTLMKNTHGEPFS